MTARRRRQPPPATYDLQRPVFRLTVQWVLPREDDGVYHLTDVFPIEGARSIPPKDLVGAAAFAFSATSKREQKTLALPDDHWVVVLPDEAGPGLVAHEAVHLTNRAFKFNGWKATRGNDEHFAATVQSFVDLIELTRP